MSEETRRVLDLLAQGKITVDEADRLLAAIGPLSAGSAATGAAGARHRCASPASECEPRGPSPRSVPGTSRTRSREWSHAGEWAFAAAVVALWVAQHRAWAALHVGAGRPVSTALGAVFVAGYLALVLVRVRALVADPERLVRFSARQTEMDPLAPGTTGE